MAWEKSKSNVQKPKDDKPKVEESKQPEPEKVSEVDKAKVLPQNGYEQHSKFSKFKK